MTQYNLPDPRCYDKDPLGLPIDDDNFYPRSRRYVPPKVAPIPQTIAVEDKEPQKARGMKRSFSHAALTINVAMITPPLIATAFVHTPPPIHLNDGLEADTYCGCLTAIQAAGNCFKRKLIAESHSERLLNTRLFPAKVTSYQTGR